MNYLEQATGSQNTNPGGNSGGGFVHDVLGLISGFLLFTCFWPLLIPFYGTGQNFTKESPLNYTLEVIWLVFLVYVFAAIARKRRVLRRENENENRR